MAGRVAPPAVGGYPAAFRALVVSSAQAMLRLAQQANPVLAAGDREQVLHVLGYALALPEAWPVTRELLLCLAPQMEQAGLREEWIPFLQKGIDLSLVAADVSTLAELRLHLGILFRSLGRWDEASILIDLSLSDFSALDDSDGRAKALNQSAYLARLQGNHNRATNMIIHALTLCDENSKTQALCHTTRGAIAVDSHEWELAEYNLVQALHLWELHNNSRLMAWSLSDLGFCQWKQKKLSEATESYEKAIAIFQEIEDSVLLATTRMNFALVQMDLMQYQQALQLNNLAEPVFRRTCDRLRLAMIYNNRGLIYRYLEIWEEAERAYLTSIEIWQELGDKQSLANVMDGLSVVFIEQRFYQKACQMLADALHLLEPLDSNPEQKSLRQMITKRLGEIRQL